MTPHIQTLLDYINAHKHHVLRHDADWHLEDDFSARKLSPTKRSAEALKAMGCDIIQGYYFSKPVSGKEFEKFLVE